ncbi:hypothetical protein JRO89_XS04G0146000 [Xanthoceras sorbifolium]|uniref:RNase H type-1 domain-containing protein n=1 Tax=Xanthoceras sorbifolium TaxID=99658 RepID=A0ABQ8I5A4_9ROSI|nr:hypothetical protein JRO89_XS04G0146000 [Xanthoceras sorbifolium]
MGLGFVLIVLQGIVYHGQADLRVQQRRTVQRKRIIENAQARMMCRVWSTLMESGYRAAMDDRVREACLILLRIKSSGLGVVWSLKPMLMQFGDVRRLGRNAFIHSGSGRLAEGLIAWALGSLKEFQISKSVAKFGCGVSAFGYIGLSTIIRDSAGWVVAASYKSVHGSFSVDAGELLALRDGLLLAKRMGCSVQLVESDFSNAIGMVSNVVSCFRDIGCVIFDVKALCEEVGVVTCCVISRFRNGAAYSLAVLALSSLEDRFLQNICLIVCCPLL